MRLLFLSCDTTVDPLLPVRPERGEDWEMLQWNFDILLHNIRFYIKLIKKLMILYDLGAIVEKSTVVFP